MLELQAKTERELVTKWVELLSGPYQLREREKQVAVEYLLTYRRLEESGKKLKTKEEKDAYDPMNLIRRKEVLNHMVSNLDMTFDAFRGYTKSLSTKGFFSQGTITKSIRVSSDRLTITVTLEDG